MRKNVFGTAASRIPIKLLDAVIVIGIAAMALLIPYLSAKGGFTVSFDAAGGTAVETQYLRYGEPIVCPEPPTREAHVFCGWYYDREGENIVDFNSAKADSDITIFAVWKEK